MWENMQLGFSVALSFENLFYCLVGVSVGTFIGVLPGIGGLAAIAMLLPLTFHLDPTTAIVMLAGIYYGAQYGGSTASILLNLPGTPSAAVACFDGNPLAKQGRAALALFLTAIASFVGGSIGVIVLMWFAPTIASVGLAFGPAEYFGVMVLGLILSATIAKNKPIHGVCMVLVGVLLGVVGTDVNTGTHRFTLGVPSLMDGISLVAMAMGLFGVSEVIGAIMSPEGSVYRGRITFRDMLPTRKEARSLILPMLRGTGIGGLIGTLPGTGMTVASFLSYATEKKLARDKSRFGNGALEGVTAPEAANNASAQTAFIPTLTLGIPGDVTMALMLGALMLHGISPGPGLVRDHPDLFWGLVASFWIGNLLLLVLNIPLIGLWVRLLSVPYRLLYPSILVLICIGVYSIGNSYQDVIMVMAFGLLGFVLKSAGLEPAPMLIGFVLGPMLEENFRRALLLSRGSFIDLFASPISASLLFASVVVLLWGAWTAIRQARLNRRGDDPRLAD